MPRENASYRRPLALSFSLSLSLSVSLSFSLLDRTCVRAPARANLAYYAVSLLFSFSLGGATSERARAREPAADWSNASAGRRRGNSIDEYFPRVEFRLPGRVLPPRHSADISTDKAGGYCGDRGRISPPSGRELGTIAVFRPASPTRANDKQTVPSLVSGARARARGLSYRGESLLKSRRNGR